MSDKVTFTFEIDKIRMEFGCSEQFAEKQMARMERLAVLFGQAMGRAVAMGAEVVAGKGTDGQDDQQPD